MLVARFVDFRWSVKFSLRIGILEQQDGVVWGPSLLAYIASNHWNSYMKLALLAIAATLLQRNGGTSCMWFRWPLVLPQPSC